MSFPHYFLWKGNCWLEIKRKLTFWVVMFEHEGVHQHRWCQDTLGFRSMMYMLWTLRWRVVPGDQLITPWWYVGSAGRVGSGKDPADPDLLCGSFGNVWRLRLETSIPSSPLPLLRRLFGAVPKRFPVIIQTAALFRAIKWLMFFTSLIRSI